ncbi:TetR/AcrR family transcriptional regulator [Thermomicrobium sp. CFH 73360]|uniref:TetR/AcrR family transcriptional regulator n=1 Tax=Thermomicrobium sp. CFH 73360 TaxID=2951987 RepID=UPI0020766C9E|nr:TetR/AcrR family transcriptional regulator [Thermomicrobium sp. CFH 73360]MCM8745036.1 TetR/AcrR family transcriptional regulator [Thermomicrobium sp. CFH 73360]
MSAARERVQAAAERLFAERGYKAVTLRDIAQELGIRQASLYYHFPGGKEELYVTVTERGLQAHREGLEQAITAAGASLEEGLRAVLLWLAGHAPVDLARMLLADFPAISEEHRKRLTDLALDCLVRPIESMLQAARQRGEGRDVDTRFAALAILSTAEAMHAQARLTNAEPTELVNSALPLLLSGLRR